MTLHSIYIELVVNTLGVAEIPASWHSYAQWLLGVADVLTAVAFVMLSVLIFRFLSKRKDLTQTRPTLVLFGVLLALVAVNHFAEIYSLWRSSPLLCGLLDVVTALTAVFAAVTIWPLLPRLLKVPSAKTLQNINLKLQREITERTKVEKQLQLHQNHLELLVRARTKDLEDTTRRLQNEIKQRKEAEDQVIFQASLLDQLESAIIASNSQHEIVYWNKYAEKLLGWTKEEVLGRLVEEVLISEDERKSHGRRVSKLYRAKRWEGDLKVLHQDGHTIPIYASSTILQGEQQQEIGYAFVCFDMSVQVRVKDRLQKAKAKAEKAAVAKQDFLSTMSHEIRTPLNVVIGMARLLMDEDPKPEQVEYLKSLQFSANNLLVIINDILDFSKIEAGKVKLETINFSIHEVVEGVINAFIFRAEEKKIALKFVIDEAVPERIVGDQVRLTQVLNNLVSNAIKFTEQGFVSIHVKALNHQDKHTDISFEVRDSGIGIGQDKIRTIFNSFTQATTDTTRKFGGTGLGLTICKRLVELQGGSIQVKSKEGIGSNFGFTLTYREADQQVSQSILEHEVYQLSGIRLLLVEDNPSNRMVACSFLGKMGVQVTIAEHGAEALRLVQVHDFDIILMDLQMPKMDGYEATRAIRQLQGSYKNLPIIALTADAISDTKNRVLKAGMNDYLSKPFNPNALYQKISDNLNISDALPEMPEEEDILTLYDIVEKYNNDNTFVIRLLESLRASFVMFAQQVVASVADNNLHELRRVIHKLLPSIHMVENKELLQQLDQLKEALAEDQADAAQVKELVQAVKKSTKASVDYIDHVFLQAQGQKEQIPQTS